MRSLLIFFFIQSHFLALGNLDSLKHIVSTQSDTTAVLAGYELGKKYVRIDLDSSLNYLREAAILAESLNFVSGQISTYRALGALCVRAGGYEESLDWLEKGIVLIDENNLPAGGKVDLLTNEGVAHIYVGKTGLAISTYLEALKICRENNLIARQTRLYNNLGIFYRQSGDFEKAIGIYDQAFALRESLNDSLGMANILYNKTAAYAKLSNYEKAIEDIDRALALYQKVGTAQDIHETKMAKASALNDLGQPEKAYAILLPLSYASIDDLPTTAQFNLFLILAEIDSKRRKPTKALQFLKTIEDKIVASEYIEQISKFHEIKAEASAQLGDYKNAFLSTQLYINNQNEVATTEKRALEKEMQARFEISEKDYQIDILNKEKALSGLKIKAQKNRNIFLGLGLGILSLLLFSLYKLYQKSASQNIRLQKSEKQKVILLKEIHHRVRNNLQVISSLLSLQARKVQDDTTKAALRVSKSRVQSMAILHQNLYTNEDLTSINVNQYIGDLCRNLINTYQVDHQVKIEVDVDEMEVDIDSLIPIGLIINEVVCNSLKYAFPDKREGKIHLSFKKMDQEVSLKISDNGIGLPDGRLEIKKASLGAKLINSFVDRLHGKIEISNDNGAVFRMRFPNEIINPKKSFRE